jgi:hypothetical protein
MSFSSPLTALASISGELAHATVIDLSLTRYQILGRRDQARPVLVGRLRLRAGLLHLHL